MTDFKPPFRLEEGMGASQYYVVDSAGRAFCGPILGTMNAAKNSVDNANRLAGYEPPRTIKVEIPKPWGAQYVPQNIVQVRFDTPEQAEQLLDAIKEANSHE